jgi:hypothetical protein
MQSNHSADVLEPFLKLERFFALNEVFFGVQDSLVEPPHPKPSVSSLSTLEVHQIAPATLATITHIKSYKTSMALI